MSLLERLGFLAFEDVVGRGIVVFTLILFGPGMVSMEMGGLPFSHVLSPEIQGPAVTLLLLGMLLTLCSCDDAVKQVLASRCTIIDV